MVQNYLFPQSISDTLTTLQSYHGQARIIAGGTDLLLDIPSGKIKASCLLDISRISELRTIDFTDNIITIGAAVTHNQTANSTLIREKAAVLAQAAASVGSLQIRNSGTVIGNVVRAQPAADTAVALVALGAQAVVASTEEIQTLLVEQMYTDVGRSIVDSTTQLATCVKFPALKQHQGSAFERLSRRKSLSLPMLNVAAVVSLAGNQFEWVRIAMAPVGRSPLRATKVEEALQGAVVNTDNLITAAKLSIQQANPRNSALRGSRDYRLQVLPVLIKRALEAAVSNARKTKPQAKED